ncbi:MAG: hypothetical protein U5L01_07435 [Rheinheimera sp.]|nr:hypothetical protein [Rheinheimera sp.]
MTSNQRCLIQNYAHLLLSKHDTNGTEIWFHEYSAEQLGVAGIDNGPFVFPRGGVVELSNGDILVFGSVGNPLDCYAFKFDSLGNHIDHVSWGHPT